jgi:nucleoside-diphosphate-sugar epimerase
MLREAGWRSKISLRDSIAATVAWYRDNIGAMRK